MTQEDSELLNYAYKLSEGSAEQFVENFNSFKDKLRLSEKDSDKKYTEEDLKGAIKNFLSDNEIKFTDLDSLLDYFMVKVRHFKNKC